MYGGEGWNMFKLMHRKARGEEKATRIRTINSGTSETGLSGGDLMMVCASYDKL
ncbi:hypothetical protein OH492_16775 [Vibrio chagasii]|nr:hypothetical protein [Vibrio chagasii]